MADKHFFEKVFSSKDYVFTHKFDKELLDSITENKKSGTVLDLGCGEGGLAIELAKNGFKVHCIDISKRAIDKISEINKLQGLGMIVENADLEYFRITQKYDVIICSAVLHFLKKEKALQLLENIKENTLPGGLNIITAFRDTDPNSEEDQDCFYPGHDELKSLYSGWDITEYEEYDDPDEEEDIVNKVAYILAQKMP